VPSEILAQVLFLCTPALPHKNAALNESGDPFNVIDDSNAR
jgi:hypothetical protein